ncbi:TIM barrel protein [candidate division WWE3 bacterium]|uniref:TIM barrel protein n=1 Tax=candidate division WWE3 bacterium TaxID=2053526 RepID=A0A955LVB9_UNCKA|nr:TIM barrel protein [candidate division WWE3 bacterium]
MSLRFHVPSTPNATVPKTFINGLTKVKELGLDGIEVPFGRGIFMKKQEQIDEATKVAKELQLSLTIHAPYYINLNAKEQEKIDASIERIMQSARIGNQIGASSVCFHAGYTLGNDPKDVIINMRKSLDVLSSMLKDEGITLDIRPETAGKLTQMGNLEETLALCHGYEQIKPCIDFAHLMATSNGKINDYNSFCTILETIKSERGESALKDMHIHAGSVAFGEKGEIKALNLDDPKSIFNYEELLRALLDYDVEGWIVAETPNVEEGALLLKHTYENYKKDS